MSNIYDEQLKRMKDLMGYGINESTARGSQSIVEYKTEGAAGMDLCAAISEPITLKPLERKLIP